MNFSGKYTDPRKSYNLTVNSESDCTSICQEEGIIENLTSMYNRNYLNVETVVETISEALYQYQE
jgi:hypothetical protein